LDADIVRVFRGHRVLELLPNVAYPRATAIEAIRDVVEQRGGRRPFTIYVGTDIIDDDAFDAVHSGGIGVVVGRRAALARYRLSTRKQVDAFIAGLAVERRNAIRLA
jgi:trehalose 6-phosphate phosphatase